MNIGKNMRQGTVCFFILDNRVLLAHIEYAPGDQKWSGIGGFLNDDETPEQATVREIKEEIDLDIKVENLIYVKEKKYPEKGTHLIVFVCKSFNDKFNPIDPTIKELKWFSFDEVPYEEMWKDNKEWLPELLNKYGN